MHSFAQIIEQKKKDRNILEYQPSGTRGTRSPPATPERLQHLTARLIQNGLRGLEIGKTLC